MQGELSRRWRHKANSVVNRMGMFSGPHVWREGLYLSPSQTVQCGERQLSDLRQKCLQWGGCDQIPGGLPPCLRSREFKGVSAGPWGLPAALISTAQVWAVLCCPSRPPPAWDDPTPGLTQKWAPPFIHLPAAGTPQVPS